MAFQYSPFVNPYAASIGETLAHQHDAAAHAAEVVAAAQAHAQEVRGQAWAGAVQGIGQSAAGAIQQATDPRAQIERAQLAQLNQTRSDMQSLDKAYATPGGRDAILGALPGHLRPVVSKQLSEADEAAAKVQEAQLGTEKATTDYVTGLADTIAAHDFDPIAAQGFISHAKETFKNNPSLLSQVGRVEQAIHANPTAAGVQAIIAPILKAREQAAVDKARGAKYAPGDVSPILGPTPPAGPKLETVPEGGTVIDQTTHQPVFTAPSKADTITQQSDRYINILTAQKLGHPISDTDKAWASSYVQQKTIGPEAAAAAASLRQANTIAEQNALQRRSQDFNEAQAGRKELTEKVEQPFQTALGSAQTLRDVVSSAQQGNKVAASLQSLETTMSAIKAQGLNRINSAEIGVTANAGSLYDRLVGRLGKLVSGEPVPADVQKDMTEFAGILEKAAYKKYSDAWDTTVPRYKLGDEKKLAPPGAPAEGTEGNVNGKPAVWKYINGKWGWAPK